MIKRIKLLALFILTFFSVFSQEIDRNIDFLIMSTDTTMHEYKYVSMERPFLGTPYIDADNNRFSLNQVKFYQNETGFFANTSEINFWGTPQFTQCIQRGKINLFETVKTNYNPGHYNGATGMHTGGHSSTSISNYYNKGFGNLKKAKYKNLIVDLADNPQSMIHLAAYQKDTRTSTILTIGGITLAAGCIIGLISNDKKENSNDSPYIIGAVVGAGATWISYFISLSKPKHLKKAVRAYNE